MKILSISLDKTILDADSIGAKKTREYSAMVEKYVVVASTDKDGRISLDDKTEVFGVGGNAKLLKWWKMYALAKMLVKKYRFDLVTTQDPFELGLIGFLLKKKYNIAWQTQEHGDFFSRPYWKDENLLNRLRYYIGLYLIKKADGIRVVSSRIENFLNGNLQIQKEKIVSVPVLTEYEKIPKTQKDESQEFVFLSMGRFVKQKNLELLIRAFAKVAKHHFKARLRLIGKGPLEMDLKLLVGELDLVDSVEFIPWTHDVNEQYASADCYVLSSDYEGWGRVIVEAAANRLPIVMTDTGCAGEFIRNEESGLVVPVRDEAELARAMMRMIDDANLRESFAARAYDALKNLPDKERTLALYLEGWERSVQLRMKN